MKQKEGRGKKTAEASAPSQEGLKIKQVVLKDGLTLYDIMLWGYSFLPDGELKQDLDEFIKRTRDEKGLKNALVAILQIGVLFSKMYPEKISVEETQ